MSKTLPSIAFIVFPMVLAAVLVLGNYYTWDDIAKLIKSGFSSTGPTAALFVFSVLYFGIMTCIIALIGHLDGGGVSTFCIVIPAMLPVYKKMHMRPTTLLRISVLAMGVLNLMPWAGPTMCAATVLGMEAGALWQTILPIQVCGIILALTVAVANGVIEKKRGAGLNGRLAQLEGNMHAGGAGISADSKANELARPKLFGFNIALTLAVIGLLIVDIFPSYVPFMLGVAAAILINYPGVKIPSVNKDTEAGYQQPCRPSPHDVFDANGCGRPDGRPRKGNRRNGERHYLYVEPHQQFPACRFGTSPAACDRNFERTACV